jgi:hypothetical protein
LKVLIRGLPEGSRTWRAHHGIEDYWTRTDQLLAAIYDSLQVIDWHYVTAHSKRGASIRRPRPLPRPGFERKGKGTPVSLEEAKRILPGAWDELSDEEKADRTRRGMAPDQAAPEKAEVLA